MFQNDMETWLFLDYGSMVHEQSVSQVKLQLGVVEDHM
jgi:hypothetical protein